MTAIPAYFVIGHAARIAENATMTPAAADGFPAYYLHDGGASHMAKFGSSGANSRIDIDRGAGTLPTLDRILIPSGHNLGAQTVTVYGSSTGAFSGEEATLESFTSAPGLVNEVLATPSAHRYLRVVFAGTGVWELGELWIGRTITLTQGNAFGWTDPYQPNLLNYVFDSGVTGSAELGPAVKSLGFAWDSVGLRDQSDIARMEDVLSDINYGQHTFWFQAPESAEPLRLVRLSEPYTRAQALRDPYARSYNAFAYGLAMVEDLS